MNLTELQQQLQGTTADPQQWTPPFCGPIPLRIDYNGQWSYADSPITRIPLVTLFASVLCKEEQKYYLKTPVEKVAIEVEDVPFVITNWSQEEDYLILTCQTQDKVVVSKDNPIKLMTDPVHHQLIPYCLIRHNLYGRLHQNVYYQLIESGTEQIVDDEPHLMLSSGDYRFSLGKF